MKLLAIDGNSIMNRAFYGIRALTNKKGVYTNALLGFMNIYFKNADEVKPDCVAVAFDLRSPTFRHKAAASYKANRKGMPEELAQQMPLIKEILTAMGIKIVVRALRLTMYWVLFQKCALTAEMSVIFSQVTRTAYSL